MHTETWNLVPIYCWWAGILNHLLSVANMQMWGISIVNKMSCTSLYTIAIYYSSLNVKTLMHACTLYKISFRVHVYSQLVHDS